MAKDPFAGIDDVAPPTAGEKLNLDNFDEPSGTIAALDNGEDLQINKKNDNPSNFENLDFDKDEFDSMEDESVGSLLSQEEYPTNEGSLDELSKKNENEAEDEPEVNEAEQASLDQINKALNTEFKTLDEARAFGKKPEEKEETPAITKEQEQAYQQNTNAIQYLERFLGMKDADLIKEDLTSKAIKDNEGQPLSEDQKDEIEIKISRYEDNGTDSILAQNIRNNIKSSIESRKRFNEGIDNKKTEAQQTKLKNDREELKSGFRDIFNKGKFLGVEITEEDVQKSYQEVISGKFHERLNKDHSFTAELALTARIQQRLAKASSNGSYSDGVEAVMSEVEGKPRSNENRHRARQVSARNQRGNMSLTGDSLVDSFLK